MKIILYRKPKVRKANLHVATTTPKELLQQIKEKSKFSNVR